MKKTTNYEFNLPESSDLYNVEDFNSNFSNVDEKLKEVDTPTYVVASENAALSSGEKLSVAFGKIAKAISTLISHIADATSHITPAERTTWNSKANGTHTHTKSQISDFPSSMTPTAHNHSASEITSGTLPVARGGTGNTSVDTTPTSGSTKMVTSGGVYTALSGKANSSHNHTASQITGTVPVTISATQPASGLWVVP